jgi:ATP-dependent helicase HrpB
VSRVKDEVRRLARQAPKGTEAVSPAVMAALAYPDRIGQRRPGDAARFVLSGGKGAVLDAGDPLARAPYLIATDTDGNPREARIRQAIQITERELHETFGAQIGWAESCSWSRRERRVIARRQERLGAITLEDRIWKEVPTDFVAQAMLDGVRDLGLRLEGSAARLATRVELARTEGGDFPDFSLSGLTDTLEDWLLPMLDGVRSAQDWRRFDPYPALQAALNWSQMQELDRRVPGQFSTPLGRKVAIDYGPDGPEISVRLQEMFGVTRHPESGGVPLKVTLLSPAQRPIQITRDLPGFWAGSYADVRKDMRAQYPKHPWPEDPTLADPTLRAKRRPSGR